MEGIRKRSGPKSTRQKSEEKSPINAGRCCLVLIHCPVKDAINKAVMEKSMPSVLNGRTDPTREPATQPKTQ